MKIEHDKSDKDDKKLKIERKEPAKYIFISEIDHKSVVFIITDDICEANSTNQNFFEAKIIHLISESLISSGLSKK